VTTYDREIESKGTHFFVDMLAEGWCYQDSDWAPGPELRRNGKDDEKIEGQRTGDKSRCPEAFLRERLPFN
jgi:hypothetical protein